MSSRAADFSGVKVVTLKADLSTEVKYENWTVRLDDQITCTPADRAVPVAAVVPERIPVDGCRSCLIGDQSVIIRSANSSDSFVFSFSNTADARMFAELVDGMCRRRPPCKRSSVFNERTDEVSATQYFQFYGFLTQQQNMMQDFIRTSTYQRAVHANAEDFANKIVLDVGAGTGILSFFAMQVNAKRVYAVEASVMAQYCEKLVECNEYKDRVVVLGNMVEDIVLPEMVDTIISEPMGYMLLNERMLESYVHARKFLKPGGKMFPSSGDLHFSPYSDENLFLETCSKANFWSQDTFHGVRLFVLRDQALKEYFGQPVVDTFHTSILMAPSEKWTVDFTTCSEESLHKIEIPFDFLLRRAGYIHGLAFWFEVAFRGSSETVWLSTAPSEPLTHWYQVRCQLRSPLFGSQGSHCTGTLLFTANKRLSYDVDIVMTCDGHTSSNRLDLKNPFFRYTGQPVQPPPGFQNTSPTDQHWNSMAAMENMTTYVNGMQVHNIQSNNSAPLEQRRPGVLVNSSPDGPNATVDYSQGAQGYLSVFAGSESPYNVVFNDQGAGGSHMGGASAVLGPQ